MKAKRIAEIFVDEYPAVEKDMGILFVGPAGVGKTHLAVSILAELIRGKGIQGLYCDFSELLMKIQTSFRPDAGFSKEDVLVPYVETDLLVLDELGAAKPTAWVHDILYYLLNRRYNRQGLTVVTSNYEDEAAPGERETLSDRIGYRLRSRLYEMCRLVPMRAEDYRREAVAASTNA
jgi:DNA replication protein DnaC